MQNLKLIIPFLIISSILSFQTLKFEDNIPNLLSTPENIKAQIINKLREEAQKYIFEYPTNTPFLITNLASSTTITMDKVEFTQIENLKKTHNFPDDVMKSFKAIKYAKNIISYEKFTFTTKKTQTSIEIVFGIGVRLDEKYFYVAYVKGNSSGKMIQQFGLQPYKKCWKILFWEHCKTKNKKVKRGYNENELKDIQQALKAKYAEILKSILDLEQKKILDIFKEYAKDIKRRYLSYSNYRTHIVNKHSSVDFYTNVINFKDVESTFKGHLPNAMITDIKKYVNDKNNYNFKKYVTEKTKDLKEVKLHAIVAYKSNGKLYVSYAKGISYIDLYYTYCSYLKGNKIANEDCDFDDECVDTCLDFITRVKTKPEDPLNPSGKNAKEKKAKKNKNIESIAGAGLADLSSIIYNILDGIHF